MLSVRTIITKITSSNFISILTEYIEGVKSKFIMADEQTIIGNTIINQGELAFVDEGDVPFDVFINDNGDMIAIGEIDYVEIDSEGDFILNMN